MTAFRSGYSAAANTSNRTYEDKVMLCNEGYKHKWLQNYLSDGKQTHFRVLPSFTDGIEDVALNPDGTQDTSMFELFGRVSAVLEVATGIGTRRYTFASGCFEDNSGTTVNDGWSVTKTILHRIRYKLRDMDTCKKHGAARLVDIPPSWNRWLNENFMRFRLSEPMSYVCFQVMASIINGEKVTDERGQAKWGGPYILAIRRSAMDSFLADIRTKTDPEAPLSLSNNMFGDFCSAAGGSILMLRKVKSEDARSNSDRASYSLRPMPGAYELQQDYVEKTFVPWEDLIHLPTIEEAVELCAQTFDGIAVDFGLRDSVYEEYIPADYRGLSSDISDPVRQKERTAMLQGGAASGGAATSSPTAGMDDLPMGDAPSAPIVPQTPAPPPFPAMEPENVNGTDVHMGSAEEKAAFDEALADIKGQAQ
jgi:hypothetical protein